MNIAVVTDSAADMPPAMAAAAGIRVVALNVSFGAESFRAGVDRLFILFKSIATGGYLRLSTNTEAPSPFSRGSILSSIQLE